MSDAARRRRYAGLMTKLYRIGILSPAVASAKHSLLILGSVFNTSFRELARFQPAEHFGRYFMLQTKDGLIPLPNQQNLLPEHHT
jgi:hypothetical protein